MNVHFHHQLRRTFYVLLLMIFCESLSGQHKITLTFNEDGRLIGEPLPRFKFLECRKDCKDVYQLRARVLMPIDYFKDEKNRIDSMAIETFSALNDKASMLYRVLACGKNGELKLLESIVNNSSKISKWNISKQEGTDSIIPAKLREYVKFLELFDSIRQNASNSKAVDRLLSVINKNYLEFSPFRFKIKGFQIEENCMKFTPMLQSDDYCHCISPSKQYVAVEFGIPMKLVTKDLALDSFQVVQFFAMKKFAIERYNAMLSLQRPEIEKLKTLQDYIQKYKVEVAQFLGAIEEQNNIKEICVGEERQTKLTAIQKKILTLKDTLDKKLGQFNCDNPCNPENIIFCSTVLSRWILKLVWLNGDLIRLNPFSFTNKNISIVEEKQSETTKPLSEAEIALAMKNDSIKLTFWNTAISHFQDSVLRDKNISIDSAKVGITKLIAERDAAQKDLDARIAERKKGDQSKLKNTDVNKKNADEMSSFVTVSKIRYKGWIVPYKVESRTPHDRLWLRNYYYDGTTGLMSEDRFKFDYPEDENLTLLVHNLTPGMSVKVTESISPATDSSEWSVFANDAVKQLSQLYASVQPVTAVVRNALKIFNEKQGGQEDLPNVPARVTVSAVSFQDFATFNLNTVKDESGLIGIADSLKKVPLGSTITIIANNKPTAFVVSENRQNVYNQLLNAVIDATGATSREIEYLNLDDCYTKYIKSLQVLQSAPDLIDQPLKTKNDSIPSYFSYRFPLTDSIPTYINKYSISVAASAKADSMNQIFRASSFIKVAPYHYFSLAAGIAYTPNGGAITSIDTTGGGLKINRDEDKVRLIVGVRYYPFGLYNLRNPISVFRELRWTHRLSILAATGIPKPLNNLYFGGGFDVFPGLTLTAGAHFQQQNEYEILNNQISNRSIHYRAHAFYSVTMDPTLLISAITAIFKN